jgi:hypothetical protein
MRDIAEMNATQEVNNTPKMVHWVNCIGTECGEGYTGQCTRGSNSNPEDFPADGKCLYPELIEYDPEIDALGAYEGGME